MNYSDFENINKDKLTGAIFGEQGQLQVLGWVKGPHGRWYVLECSICKLDPEMSGDGLAVSYKAALLKGHVPCPCAKNFKLTPEQNALRVKREAEKRGFKFLGWKDDKYKNVRTTYLRLECPVHGLWETARTTTFLKGIGCPKCGEESQNLSKVISTKDAIYRFMSTGCFPEGTEFKRADKQNRSGQKPYWELYCPVCDSTVETLMSTLLAGGRSCSCGTQKQNYGYINLILDGETELAIKFGITNNVERRLKQQNIKSPFKLVNLFRFRFNEISDCKASEREIKNTIVTGILTKNELASGFSETTYVHNMNQIIFIYEKYGGVRQE